MNTFTKLQTTETDAESKEHWLAAFKASKRTQHQYADTWTETEQKLVRKAKHKSEYSDLYVVFDFIATSHTRDDIIVLNSKRN